jgi:hypothetical protein
MLTLFDADKVADWEFILEGARHFAREVDFAEFLPRPFEGPKFEAAVKRIVDLAPVHVLLCGVETEDRVRIMGGLGFLVSPFLWNPDRLCTEELFWWAHPQAPAGVGSRLILGYRQRAKELTGADGIWTAGLLATSPDRIRKVYESLGMKLLQVTFGGRV